MPARFGSFVQAKDQSVVAAVGDKLRTGGVTAPAAAVYEDSGHAGRVLIVFGGITPDLRESVSDVTFAAFFKAAGQANGATITRIGLVDPGPVRGKAECAQATNQDGTVAEMCDWVTDGAQLAVVFHGYTLAQAGQDLPQILSAVVTRH
jgi:hypothetical protein